MSKPPENSPEASAPTALTSRSATRRAALMGGVAVAGAAVLLPGAASAATDRAHVDSTRKDARRINRDQRGDFAVPQGHLNDVPDDWTRHVLARFSGGVSDQRLSEVSAAGGVDAWFAQQLTPSKVPDPNGDALWNWFPVLAMTPAQRFALSRQPSNPKPGWLQMQDLANYIMLRRLISSRCVLESMVDFWSNLVHIPSPSTDCWMWRIEYEETIRQYALGRFSDLLNAAITHPAMTLYLSNDTSTGDAINEDLGRELLECHTVGVNAGYTQNDVVNSARLLTGFTIDKKGATFQQSYDVTKHWLGRVKIMGYAAPNSSPDGRATLTKYLSYLAHHSATATRIATRLAIRFVSDTPSDSLVRTLRDTYLDADTAIVPVLQALVASDDFQEAVDLKVRTPVEDAIATFAALNAQFAKPSSPTDAANQFNGVSKGIGQVVYDWPTADGFPDVMPAWIDPGRVLGSMRAHWLAAIGHPTDAITYRTPIQWAPQLPTTFDNVVDYVARSLLYRPSTPTMLQAACVATDCKTTTMIDAGHALIRYKFPRLLASLLDTPEHLSR